VQLAEPFPGNGFERMGSFRLLDLPLYARIQPLGKLPTHLVALPSCKL
jgi:hypothetical protein